MKLLLAEDEASAPETAAELLAGDHHEVIEVHDGISALELTQSTRFDGIIMDIDLPGADGPAVLKTLRGSGDLTPVMLLTSRSGAAERVKGLDAGANDCMTKPFDPSELMARIRVMTRGPGIASERLALGQTVLDEGTGLLLCGRRSVLLSHLEIRLMRFLLRNSGIYFPAEKLLERVWGYNSESNIGTVWFHISQIRKKLRSLNADVDVLCRRNIGYTLTLSR